MAITYIARTTETFTNPVGAATTVAASTAFSLNVAVGAVLRCTATTGSAAVVVKFHVLEAPGATAFELRDATDTAVSVTVSPNCAYELPSELFAAPFVAITTASGTASFLVSTKS
jgi:hypothetical protein